MISHSRIRQAAEIQTKIRDGAYGMITKESWQTMEIADLASGAKYKIGRATQPQTSKAKALDDLLDAYNYIAAIYERIAGEER